MHWLLQYESAAGSPQKNSSKRASWDFYAMIKCGTGCNPLVYKGYGCYCGFLGSGDTVDPIDRSVNGQHVQILRIDVQCTYSEQAFTEGIMCHAIISIK